MHPGTGGAERARSHRDGHRSKRERYSGRKHSGRSLSERDTNRVEPKDTEAPATTLGTALDADPKRSTNTAAMSAGRIAMASLSLIGAFLVVLVHHTTAVAVPLMVGAIAVLAVLSDIDIRTHRLPNNIVGPFAAATTVVVSVASAIQSDTSRALAAIGTGLVVALGALVLNVIGGMGMGDVKLCYPVFVIAGWLGSGAVAMSLVVTALGGLAAAAVVMLFSGRGRFSYGPFLALGSIAGMFAGAPS